MAEEIIVGAKVVTLDGKELGKVKKVEGGSFLIDAPRKLDYWLENTLAKSSSAETLELTIAESDLGGYKMDNPHDHNAFHQALPKNLDPGTVQGQSIARGPRSRL